MYKITLLFIGLIVSIFIEVSFLPFPLTLLFLILLAIFQQDTWVFFVAVISGFFLDALLFRPLGATSFFFLLTVGIIFLYQRKFETDHIVFVLLSTAIAVFFYQLFFSYIGWAISGVVIFSSALVGGAFLGIHHFQKRLKSASN